MYEGADDDSDSESDIDSHSEDLWGNGGSESDVENYSENLWGDGGGESDIDNQSEDLWGDGGGELDVDSQSEDFWGNGGDDGGESDVDSEPEDCWEESVIPLQEDSVPVPVPPLPEEVWKMILGEFVHPLDMFSIYLTCKLFQEIVEPTKKEWMFAKIFPFIYHHLDKRDILNCRVTCKSWMAGVDHRLDQKIESSVDNSSTYIGIQEFLNNCYDGYHHQFSVFKFTCPVPAMKTHPRNPFVGRAVSILRFRVQEMLVAQEFFRIRGENIFYLLIQSDDYLRYLGMGYFLKLLNGTLAMTPNLKTLNLNLDIVPPSSKETAPIPNLSCPSSMETLIIQRLTLTISPCATSADFIADLLVSPVSLQLVRLEVGFWSQRFLELKWPNLKELKLRCVESEEALLGLVEITLPALKSLQIEFRFFYKKIKVRMVFHHLVRITNHFPELASLELCNLENVLYEPTNITPLPQNLHQPSKLTTLKMLKCPLLNDFLLRFPHLKYLYVGDNAAGLEGEGYWNFPPFVPSLYGVEIFKSPIWKMLPSLQVLAFKYGDNPNNKFAYTREGYIMRPISANPSDNDPVQSIYLSGQYLPVIKVKQVVRSLDNLK